MVRMPDASALSGPPQIQSRALQRAPQDFIGPAAVRFADTVEKTEEQVQAEKRQQTDALDLARAKADWNTRLLNEEDTYKYEKNPDYGGWEKSYTGNINKHLGASSSLIGNKNLRARFEAEAQDDITRGTITIRDRASTIDLGKRKAEGFASIDNIIALSVRPGLQKGERDRLTALARTTFDNFAHSGLLTPGEVIEARQKYVHTFAGLMGEQDKENDPAKAAVWLQGGGNTIKGVILHYEGYRDTAYPDTGGKTGRSFSGYRGGYGSDTITLADGTPVKVTKGMSISRADADRDLERRTGIIQGDIAKSIGKEVWAALPVSAQAGLVSVGYNYGEVPGDVLAAAKTGDVQKIASAVASHANDNSGVNAKRRNEEAAMIANGQGFDELATPDYYQFMEPATRQRLLSEAEAEVARREKVKTEATTLETYSMEQNIQDDVRQMAEKGVPTKLDPTQVQDVLGDVKTAKWLEDRDTAAKTYQATSKLDTMPTSEFDAYQDEVEPAVGEPNFDNRTKIAKAVEAKANKLIRLRQNDPAKAVEDSTVVQKARAGVDPAKPETIQALVRARFAAQDSIGIKGAAAAPVTRQEALDIINPIIATIDSMEAAKLQSDMDNKGDAHARSLARKAVKAESEAQVKKLLGDLETTFGPYAHLVLAHSISEYVHDKQAGETFSTILTKISRGQKPSGDDDRKLAVVSETGEANNAISWREWLGIMPSTGPAPSTGRGDAGKVGNFPTPTPGAVQGLIDHPDQAADFDKKFGPGAAVRWRPKVK